MPVDVRYQVPFMPQEGITQQILTAIQLANEQHVQNQQLALRQQAQPSEIAERTAQAGLATAETAAIPQRLALTQKQIDAELEMRKATLALEQQYRLGMLGVAQSREQRQATTDAAKLENEKFKTLWQAKLDAAKIQGIQGGLILRRDALAQQKDLMEQELQLRSQANDLREKGLSIQADAVTTRADDVVNKIGIIRNISGMLGLAPETEIPPAARNRSTAPPRPPGVPAGAKWDANTRTWSMP